MSATGVTLTPVQFGRALVESGDLDPVYLMLRSAELPLALRQRWSLAYWLFYHAGVATRVAEAGAGAFWDVVQEGLDRKWPRGTERRHFRGVQAQKTVDKLQERYASAEQAVTYISGRPGSLHEFVDVKARALTWWGFGEWISFKMADMSDAVLDVRVNFVGTEAHFFDAPRKGARLVLDFARESHETLGDEIAVVRAISAHLMPELQSLRAPHAPERVLREQEYETILCKYKSHLNGHYPVGYDTKHLRTALDWAGDTPLAYKLRTALPSKT